MASLTLPGHEEAVVHGRGHDVTVECGDGQQVAALVDALDGVAQHQLQVLVLRLKHAACNSRDTTCNSAHLHTTCNSEPENRIKDTI